MNQSAKERVRYYRDQVENSVLANLEADEGHWQDCLVNEAAVKASLVADLEELSVLKDRVQYLEEAQAADAVTIATLKAKLQKASTELAARRTADVDVKMVAEFTYRFSGFALNPQVLDAAARCIYASPWLEARKEYEK